MSIAASCERWPSTSVFGGRVLPRWPQTPPAWALVPWISNFGFALHDLGDEERKYEGLAHPFGPNFWVRRHVFEGGRRYNENLGPRPTNRIMGSEASLLLDLVREGQEIVYVPESIVWHRISATALRVESIFRRAKARGRATPHVLGLPEAQLLKRRPSWWKIRRSIFAFYYAVKARCTFLLGNESRRVASKVSSIMRRAMHEEAMQIQRVREPIGRRRP